jgi:ATP-dependent Clp protease ATP-binding subunit ClpA
LNSLGVELNKVRSAVEFIIGRGDRIVLGEVGLTPRAKEVIELAVDEARRLNHHYIGTEHLLLGLVREGEGIAAGVLQSLGIKLEQVRTQTIQVLNHASSPQTIGTLPPFSPVQTESARNVLRLAQEEVQRFQHDYVGTEHLLLALIRESDGIAAQVLTNLGVELEKLRIAVEVISWHGNHPGGEVPLNQRAKEVLEQAMFEARHLNHNYLSTEHLLLGLTRVEESSAAAALQSTGINMQQVRTAVIEALNQP